MSVTAKEFVAACHYVLRESDEVLALFKPDAKTKEPPPRPSDEALLAVLNIAKEMTIGVPLSRTTKQE